MPFARDASGVSICFDLRGEGEETLVLVPGLGLAGSAWGPLIDRLEQRYRLIVVDPRGSGASDKPDQEYTPDTVAADLAAVLDAADTASAHIIGLSMGGMIAQDFAIRFPARINSLILLSTFARPDRWFTRLFEARRNLIQQIGIVDHFQIYLMFIFSPLAFRRIPETIAQIEQALQRQPPDTAAYLRQIDYCLAHDASVGLPGVTAPTLVISGSHDFLIPTALGEELADLVPHADYRPFEGASHGLWLEFPDELAAVCEDFIDRR